MRDEVRRAIKREKMHIGIAFDPVECSGVPEELQKKRLCVRQSPEADMEMPVVPQRQNLVIIYQICSLKYCEIASYSQRCY